MTHNHTEPSSMRWHARHEWVGDRLKRRHDERAGTANTYATLGRPDIAERVLRASYAPELITFHDNGLPTSLDTLRHLRNDDELPLALAELLTIVPALNCKRAMLTIIAYTKRVAITDEQPLDAQVEEVDRVGLDDDLEASRSTISVVYDVGDLEVFEVPFTLDDRGDVAVGEMQPLGSEGSWVAQVVKHQCERAILSEVAAASVVGSLELLGHTLRVFDPYCDCDCCEIDRRAEAEASAS